MHSPMPAIRLVFLGHSGLLTSTPRWRQSADGRDTGPARLRELPQPALGLGPERRHAHLVGQVANSRGQVSCISGIRGIRPILLVLVMLSCLRLALRFAFGSALIFLSYVRSRRGRDVEAHASCAV